MLEQAAVWCDDSRHEPHNIPTDNVMKRRPAWILISPQSRNEPKKQQEQQKQQKQQHLKREQLLFLFFFLSFTFGFRPKMCGKSFFAPRTEFIFLMNGCLWVCLWLYSSDCMGVRVYLSVNEYCMQETLLSHSVS